MRLATLAPCLVCGVVLAAEKPSFAVKELPEASMRIHAGAKIVEALQATEAEAKLGPPGRRRANLRGLAQQPTADSSNSTDLVTFSDVFNDIFDPKLEKAKHKPNQQEAAKAEGGNERLLAEAPSDADKAKANAKAISWDLVFDPDLSNIGGKRRKSSSSSSSKASKEERAPLPEAIQYKQGENKTHARTLQAAPEDDNKEEDTELFKFDDIFDPKLEAWRIKGQGHTHLDQQQQQEGGEGPHRVLKGGAALNFEGSNDKVLAVLEQQIEADMRRRADLAKRGDHETIAKESNAP